jgi:3-mercaptopyruvate sulfurtransferase SseA
VFYSIAGAEVVGLYSALRRAGEAHAAEVEKLVRDFIGHRDELEPVRAEELLARAKKGLVTVLDVRPAEEFAAGHLPGALNVPIDKLESSLAKLPLLPDVVRRSDEAAQAGLEGAPPGRRLSRVESGGSAGRVSGGATSTC